MALKILHTDDLKIYDDEHERCRLDGARVTTNCANGTETFQDTTDSDGLMPDNGHVASAAHATCKIYVNKTGYKNYAVGCKITWDGDSGSLGVLSLHSIKK